MVYPSPPMYPPKLLIVTVTTVPFAIVQDACAAVAPADGLPPLIVIVGATVYPEPPFDTLI